MIVIKLIGGLGNQMFQYAFVKSMATKYNTSFCIPPKNVFGKFYYQKLFSNIDECFDIKCDREVPNYPNVTERFFHYDQSLIDNIEGDCNFDGFFQSEKYFKDIESELRTNDFIFKNLRCECTIQTGYFLLRTPFSSQSLAKGAK